VKEALMNDIKYVGMDVHKSSIVIAVLNSEGKLAMESILETKARTVVDFIKGLRGTINLTIEEGTHAAWLYDLLKPLVAKLIVCDPRQNKLMQSGNKSDRIDARRLAELLRNGSLRSVYHGEQTTKVLKELVRNYECLLSDSTRVKNRLKSIFRSRAIECEGRVLYQVSQREEWLKTLKEKGARSRAQSLMLQLDSLNKLIKEALSAMVEESQRHPAYKILDSIPMFGEIRVAQVIARIASPHRFRSKRQLWKYCGLAVVTHSTSDYEIVDGHKRKSKRQPMTRGLNQDCNKKLKQVFKAAAVDASWRGNPFKTYYEKMVERGIRPEMAKLTLARKMAAVALALWKNHQPFDAAKLERAD
jgi:transposase